MLLISAATSPTRCVRNKKRRSVQAVLRTARPCACLFPIHQEIVNLIEVQSHLTTSTFTEFNHRKVLCNVSKINYFGLNSDEK